MRRRRYWLEQLRPEVDRFNQQWQNNQALHLPVELIHQEIHDMEIALAVGMGLRSAGGYVLSEPPPTPATPLVPDNTRYLFVLIAVQMHRQDDVTLAQMKMLLATFPTRGAIEYISFGGKVYVQLTIPSGTEAAILGFLRTSFPFSRFLYGTEDLLAKTLGEMTHIYVMEYRLSNYTVYPLSTDTLNPPRLETLCSIPVSPWARGATFGVQVILSPCRANWYQYYLELSRWTALPSTKVLSPHLPKEYEILGKCAREGMYAVNVRVFGDSPQILDIVQRNFIASFNAVNQQLVPNGRNIDVNELVERCTRQEGILMGSDELAQLASLPPASVMSYALDRTQLVVTHVPPDFIEGREPDDDQW